MAKGKKSNLQGLEGPQANGEINVTPLIDVVLVLLIIFMVLTPIIIEEMAVNLPSKTESVKQDNIPKEQLLVAACADGTYALNRKPMTLEELHKQVRRKLKQKKEKVVFVDGHPEAPYNKMVALMDSVRDAGAERIGLASTKAADDFIACSPREAAEQ
ncbi:MAG: biopolymer transport protein ExbD [Myxococcota bacterium]